MKSLRKMLRFIGPLLVATLITACGGGGGSSSASTPVASTLGGVAAVGSPIVGGTINVTCAGGSPLTTTTTSTGAWQVTIAGQTPPCAVQINGGTINSIANATPYLSIATSFGTVNVTPLTNLLLANLAATATPNVWFAGLTPASFTPITLASVNAALARQCAALSGLTQLCATNPITTVFTPTSNNIMDYMLIALQLAMTNSGASYAALLSNAAIPGYTAPVAGFNTALTTAYTTATTTPISATAIAPTQILTVGTAMTSFSPLTASGGTTPYAYSYTGTLPAGLSFNTSTGAVTGTPTATYATANLIFSVKDANNVVASMTSTVSFTVVAAGGISGTAAQYFFTKKAVGNSWTTLETDIVTPTGAATITYTYTDTFSITASAGGTVTYSDVYTSGTPPVTTTRTNTSHIDSSGAWVFTDNSGGTVTTSVVLPSTFSVGTTWVERPATATEGASYATVVAFNVTRTVPAGTFTDCLRVDSTQTNPDGSTSSYSSYYSPTAGFFVDDTGTYSNVGSTQTTSSKLQAGYIANP